MQVVMLLLPLLIALAAIFFIDKEKARYLALGGSLISLIMLLFVSSGGYSITILSIGNYVIQLATNVANINLMLLGIVLIIAPIVILYSFGYINSEREQKRFYIEMLAFEAAMLLFAVSYSFITLFIAWEFLSLTSYLLIGFWYEKEVANRAARKAISIVFIGDMCILAVIAIVLAVASTLNFSTVFTVLQNKPGVEYIVAILLMIAIFTKSAQFPFSEWLPDAMEGPTPVSAFLHSSTMVKAGIFTMIILLPIFSQTGLNTVIFYMSLITIVLATMNALKEKHIKKIIAYSTVQELGLMALAISGGAIAAGIYFFFAQSFYKMLLFFSSGVIINANEKTNIDETSGLKVNKIIYITTLFGILSLAGFIPFDGFFASIGISSAFGTNLLIFAALNVFGLFTSIYSFRWMFLNSKKSTAGTNIRYLSTPKSMVYSMVIGAILTLLASVAFFYLSGFIFGSTVSSIGISSISITGIIMESLIAAAGVGIAFIIYKKGMSIKSRVVSKIINNGIIMNALYSHIANGVYGMADGTYLFEESLAKLFDNFGKIFVELSSVVRRASVGNINTYALMLSAGIIMLFVLVYIITGV